MRSLRGNIAMPVLTALAFVAAIGGGVAFGQHHPYMRIKTHGEWTTYKNAKGQTIRAYVAYPERADKAPAIIIIHEIYGMTDWEPTVADRFAGKGYVAIAPDLLSSQYKSTDSVGAANATRMVSGLPDSQVVGDLNATYDYVNGLVATDKGNIGVIGFCWGGGTTWKFAAANSHLKAAVACYGPVTDTTLLHTVTAPVFGIYAEKDMRVTGMRPAITAAMENNHKSFVSDVYKGVSHGFLKPGRDGYGTPEYDRAMSDIDAFFAKQLQHK
ncbi:MAG TPA: dienelactone hydrolase family protein [Gemmatimonadales bacterium]|jgi:carboxymethylenebutenolidase|nr:dienelactone hydrolase family protein [Gemmatimonadales bacterium]